MFPMEVVHDESSEELGVLPERRENQWAKPPVLIAIISLFFQAVSLFLFVGGAVLVAYATSKSDKVTSDMTNTQVVSAIQKLEMKIDSAVTASQQANSTNTTQEGAINTLTRDMTEIKSNLSDLTKTVEANAKAQTDYNFNLKSDLIKAQAQK